MTKFKIFVYLVLVAMNNLENYDGETETSVSPGIAIHVLLSIIVLVCTFVPAIIQTFIR